MRKISVILALLATVFACQPEPKATEPIEISSEDLHASVDRVTAIMIHDIFSPPVASRIFAYPNIAAYEIVAQSSDEYLSLAGQITDLTPIPAADTTAQINHHLSALVAHMELSKRLIFSEDRMEALRDSLYGVWEAKMPCISRF